MISKTELSKTWAAIGLNAGENVGRRADASHPLDFFITYDENPNMQFMLVTDFDPSLPNSSSQILVRGNQRNDGRYAVCFSLADSGLRDQFISLCWDIMDCTVDVQNRKSGAIEAIKRFTMWQKLFAEYKTKKLTDMEIRGLIGELTVLKDICFPRYGVSSSVAGWIGPIGADRDFEYSDYWYESKYVSLSMDNVSISSFDQLDTDNEGFIIISRAEKTAPEADGSITLNRLVNNIKKIAATEENAIVTINNRLALIGYDASDDRADESFMIHRIEKYRVDSDEFPRIRRSRIHTALSNGKYSLSIPALHEWKTETIL